MGFLPLVEMRFLPLVEMTGGACPERSEGRRNEVSPFGRNDRWSVLRFGGEMRFLPSVEIKFLPLVEMTCGGEMSGVEKSFVKYSFSALYLFVYL